MHQLISWQVDVWPGGWRSSTGQNCLVVVQLSHYASDVSSQSACSCWQVFAHGPQDNGVVCWSELELQENFLSCTAVLMWNAALHESFWAAAASFVFLLKLLKSY